jgi:hypothetical protein
LRTSSDSAARQPRKSSMAWRGGAHASGLLSYREVVWRRLPLLHILFLLLRHPRPPAPASGPGRLPPRGRIWRRVEAERGVVVRVVSWWPPPGGEESAKLGETDGGSDGFGGRGVSAAHTASFAPSATACGLASPPPGRTGRTRRLVKRRAPRLLASAGSFLQNVHHTNAG